MKLQIREMTSGDWEPVRSIYIEGIEDGDATFETQIPDRTTWESNHRPDCRLVALCDGEVAGWAALSSVSPRTVYSGVAEVSVYVARRRRGRGLGKALLEALVQSSEGAGYWTLQAGVFPENQASIALHEACGFRVVGRRERIGRHRGHWRDVTLMERRSGV